MANIKKIQPLKNCRVCGNQFSKPSKIAVYIWNKRESCSKICGATHKNLSGSYNPLAKSCENPSCRQLFTKNKKDTHVYFSTQRYCSISCSKMGKNTGKDNPNWKGDNVEYSGVHIWMRKIFGKPNYCEHCGTKKRRMYHWANKSGEHKRDRNDWLRLCVPCHKKFDSKLS